MVRVSVSAMSCTATSVRPSMTANPTTHLRLVTDDSSRNDEPSQSGVAEPRPVPAPVEISDAERETLRRHGERLETAAPLEIIQWAAETYRDKLCMATAFGPEGCVILHFLAQVKPDTYVFNLDTGYQFRETLELRDRIARRYGIEVELKQPELSVAAYERVNGGPVYQSDPDRCCFDRKIRVLHRSVEGMTAWMSGIRRDQSEHRAKAAIVGWDKKFGLVKISPLANWTKKEVWDLIVHQDIPYNPLHDQGYTSIGCWPCTKANTFGQDERAGRWSGSAKTECGLHTSD